MFDVSLPVHDPVLIFALVMLIVLIAPLVFARLRVPGLVGLILCGALVGPSGIGLLERDETMILLGTVGLLYLMFVAGLALDLNQFNRQRHRSIVFGLLSFVIPQSMGILAGVHLLGFEMPSAVLLGSIVGSHTLIAYPIASRLGIARNRAIVMTMGGTIVTDMLALLLLAVVVASVQGAIGWVFWLKFVGLIVAYLVLVLEGLPRVGRWFLRATRNDPNIAFVFLVTALFVTAYLADVAGLAPIIGAFIAGLVLNRLVPDIGPLMSRVKFVGETMFIPFFLLSVGMLVDFRVLAGLDVWYAAAVLTACVLLGKGIASIGAQRLFGFSTSERWAIFGLSIPQAAATLAVTLVGFNIGLFDQPTVNAVVVLILITCLLGPWLVEQHGRRVALKEEERPYRESEAPQRILIPLSNPATSDNLVDVALAVRWADSNEPFFPLAVVREGEDVSEEVAKGEKLLSNAVQLGLAADVSVTPITRIDSDVARGIVRAVAEQRISHVVIGWGGPPSSRRRIFGTVLDRLLDLSRETVVVCRLDLPINTMQRVVLVVPPLAEREPSFDDALRTVKQLSNRIGTDLTVVATDEQMDVVQSHTSSAPPVVPVEFESLKSFGELFTFFEKELTDRDLVVLLSAREHQAAWQPALDRVPRQFVQRFADVNFMVIFPFSQVTDATPILIPDGIRTTTTMAPRIERVHTIEATDGVKALMEILDDDAGLGGTVASKMLDELSVPRHEIAPGVVLLHQHSDRVPRQMFFVGLSREGVVFEGLAHPASIILVLLSPADIAPPEHLQALAHVARAVYRAQDIHDPDQKVNPDILLQALAPEARAGTPV